MPHTKRLPKIWVFEAGFVTSLILDQWPSNSGVHQNDAAGNKKYRLPGPTP